MSLVHAYCTVEDVRGQLKDSTSKLNTQLIERAVAATSRAIDKYCGRRFWQDPAPVAREYEVWDSCGPAYVDDISTTAGLIVKVDGSGSGLFSTTWASTDYQLRPLNADADGGAYSWRQIAPLGGRYFPPPISGRTNLQVTARWGWSAIPDGVIEAAILKATALFERRNAPFGVAGFAEFGAVRITRKDPDVIELLDPFALMVVA